MYIVFLYLYLYLVIWVKHILTKPSIPFSSGRRSARYDLTCDSGFASGEFARCHCSASEKATEALVDQNANLPALP